MISEHRSHLIDRRALIGGYTDFVLIYHYPYLFLEYFVGEAEDGEYKISKYEILSTTTQLQSHY